MPMRHCHALRCSWLAATPSSSSSSSPMQAMMMCAPRTAIRKFRPSLHARPGRVEAAAAAVRRVPFVASSGSGVPRVGPGAQQCRALSSSGPTISAGPPGAAPEATPRDDIVFDVDDETFMPKVLGPPPAGKERVPVIVQCTAEWCGPCKELSPVLEAVVRSYNGGVQLAVLDIDKAQGVAAQMRVQSVPFVLGFKPGKQPDGQEGMTVAGAFPGGDEAAMREWITDVLGAAPVEVAATPQSLLGDGAEFLDGGDVQSAMAAFNQALQMASEGEQYALQADATAGLLQCYMAMKGEDPLAEKAAAAAAQALQDAPLSEHASAPNVAQTLASYKLQLELGAEGSDAELAARAEGGDLSARLLLAKKAFGHGDVEAALDQALAVLKEDRDYDDGAPRETLLTFFDALGPSHPLSLRGRRRMANLLYV